MNWTLIAQAKKYLFCLVNCLNIMSLTCHEQKPLRFGRSFLQPSANSWLILSAECLQSESQFSSDIIPAKFKWDHTKISEVCVFNIFVGQVCTVWLLKQNSRDWVLLYQNNIVFIIWNLYLLIVIRISGKFLDLTAIYIFDKNFTSYQSLLRTSHYCKRFPCFSYQDK